MNWRSGPREAKRGVCCPSPGKTKTTSNFLCPKSLMSENWKGTTSSGFHLLAVETNSKAMVIRSRMAHLPKCIYRQLTWILSGSSAITYPWRRCVNSFQPSSIAHIFHLDWPKTSFDRKLKQFPILHPLLSPSWTQINRAGSSMDEDSSLLVTIPGECPLKFKIFLPKFKRVKQICWNLKMVINSNNGRVISSRGKYPFSKK